MSILSDFLALFRRRAPAPKLIPAQTVRVPYGLDPLQFYDLYIPAHYDNETVGAMGEVHGGAWRRGEADSDNVVANKVPWLDSLKLAFVSFSYRLGVDSNPRVEVVTQAQDIAAALAHLRANGAKYGLDLDRFALSGHSAGAHIVLLVNTKPALLKVAGGAWWRCVVSLDAATTDVQKTMQAQPQLSADMRAMFNAAFNTPPCAGPDYWLTCDPMGQMQAALPPTMLIVSATLSTNLRTAQAFVAKARGFGTDAPMPLLVALTHSEVNANLGLEDTPVNADYTKTIEAFVLSHID